MLPELGHYFPTLKLAASLRDRHSVVYLTISAFQEFFSSFDFNVHIIPLSDLEQRGSNDNVSRGRSRNPSATTGEMLSQYLRTNRMALAELVINDLNNIGCDLLICDSFIAPHLTLPRSRIRAGRVIILSPVLPDLSMPDIHQNLAEERVQEFVLCPAEFEIGPVPIDKHRMYGEPCVFQHRGPVHDSSTPPPQSPFTYCTFGTQWSRYPGIVAIINTIIEAYRNMPTRRLIIVADCLNSSQVMPLSDNIELLDQAPQLEMLSRCELFITHGGLGGVKEAILAGVPMLVIPCSFDQHANARRVEFHKLGLSCAGPQVTAETVREFVDKILSDAEIPEWIIEMQSVFAAREQESPIANAIHGFLKT